MPKSKRTKLVSLTRTQAKTKDAKTKLILKIHENISKYSRIAIITYNNFNNSAQLALRSTLGSLSKIVFGKKSILKLALTTYKENDEINTNGIYSEHLEMLSDFIDEQSVALIFSNLPTSALKSKLENFKKIEYALPNSVSPANVLLTKGDSVFKNLSVSNDNYLRGLGLDVIVKNGKLWLESDFLVAKKNEMLESKQCKILKLLGIKIGKVKVFVKAVFDMENNNFEKYV